ncbi:DeoR/GlpR transcriptional regulator, partial [Burkholderia cenocepacia]|nr:DeoR/GlpR transcriptional regulator [Burkholderia cenocepacia]
GRVTPVRINGAAAARYLVTERAPDKAVRRALTARGIELLVCD